MIKLDGNNYSVFNISYAHREPKYSNLKTGLTGHHIRIESEVIHNVYPLTLLCTVDEVSRLRQSYYKVSTSGTPPANLLSFTDEEGVTYDPASGTDTPTHKYSTGVYFDSPDGELNPKPLAVTGWNFRNRFTVDILLTVND